MTRTLLTTFAAAMAVTAASAQASVPPLDGLFADSEVRRSASLGWERREEVIRLNSDGSFSGIYEKSRPVSQGRTYRYSGKIQGTWTFANGQLCLQGSGLEHHGPNCYAISKGKYSANEYSGRDTKTGDRWEIFVYHGS